MLEQAVTIRIRSEMADGVNGEWSNPRTMPIPRVIRGTVKPVIKATPFFIITILDVTLRGRKIIYLAGIALLWGHVVIRGNFCHA